MFGWNLDGRPTQKLLEQRNRIVPPVSNKTIRQTFIIKPKSIIKIMNFKICVSELEHIFHYVCRAYNDLEKYVCFILL